MPMPAKFQAVVTIDKIELDARGKELYRQLEEAIADQQFLERQLSDNKQRIRKARNVLSQYLRLKHQLNERAAKDVLDPQ